MFCFDLAKGFIDELTLIFLKLNFVGLKDGVRD